MKRQTDVAVIGGGIAGCSTLYHLTQEGITDCVLIERDELTSGTTWHSAAQVTNFGVSQTMVGLKSHSIKLYKELAEDPDYPINYHHGTGGIRLATTEQHVEGYKHYISVAKSMGVDLEYIDAEECKRRHPLISTEGLLGGVWDPQDGDIDPAQLCQALARRARKAGAEIYRFNPVTDLVQRSDGTWDVVTQNGTIHAEKIVNCGGYRSNEIAAMYGQEHAIASMEHQYMVTEPISGLEDLHNRVPILRCPTHDFYARQERNGLLVGFYEQDCKPWGLGGVDPNFTNALCPDDLDRVTDVMEGIFTRLPCLMDAGIQSVVNGPITYTPDGPPLVGRIPGLRNAYACCGLRIGLGEGGGHGWLAAQIIAHGEACYDTWSLDPARFPPQMNEAYASQKAIEDYMNEMRFHLPHEHRPMGRPLRTTPLYGRQKELGAQFFATNGWERADFYAPDPDFCETHDFRFTNAFDLIGAEVETVQNRVGLAEVAGFGRFEITGPGLFDWLDRLSCSRIPRKTGRVALAYFLTPQGNVFAEATVAVLSQKKVWVCVAAAAEQLMQDWLTRHLPNNGDVTIQNITSDRSVLVVSGPLTMELLHSAAPFSNWHSFSWLQCKHMRIDCIDTVALGVSFSGELSVELHVPTTQVLPLFDTLWREGKAYGAGMFGARAAEAMRIEKGYRAWRHDLITEFNPLESDLSRFVRFDKAYVGRAALDAARERGQRKSFVTLEINANHAPALSGASILNGRAVIGSVTSGSWGYRTGKNLALGFVEPGFAAPNTELLVDLLGEPIQATIIPPSPYDIGHERLNLRPYAKAS